MQVNEMVVALGVPLGAFFMAVAIVGMVGYFKNQERRQRAELIKLALEKGQPLPPALLDPELSLATQFVGIRGRRGDLERGIQLSFLGVGVSLFLWIFRPDQPLWAVGLVILFTGFGKMVSHSVSTRQPPVPSGPPAA